MGLGRSSMIWQLLWIFILLQGTSADIGIQSTRLGNIEEEEGALPSGNVLFRSYEEGYLGVQLVVNNTQVDLLDMKEDQTLVVTFFLQAPLPPESHHILVQEKSPDMLDHVRLSPQQIGIGELGLAGDGTFLGGTFNITGTFLGFSKLQFSLMTSPQVFGVGEDGEEEIRDGKVILSSRQFTVKVHRAYQLLDIIFTSVMVVCVAVLYINMGCAIDLNIILSTLKKPVAPAIGLASQYFFMPITSYVLGYLMFYDTPAQWLGMFMIGCSPGGGGSNVWTHLLGGSLDLSVTMTFVSTVAAFGALPLWVYALARTIFKDGDFEQLPYGTIASMVVGLLVPCAIGVLIKRFRPNAARILKKLLTPVAVLFVLFATTFGVYANLYIFFYFTWKVVLAGMALPWLGFMFGAITAFICRRRWEEIIAISVETGIQNTGLAVGVIKFALQKYSPLGDVTVVVPVAVATLTPIPLLFALVVKKIYTCFHPPKDLQEGAGIDGPMQEEASISNLKMTPATSRTPLHNDIK